MRSRSLFIGKALTLTGLPLRHTSSKKVRVLFVSIQYHLLYEIHKDILRPQINLLVTVTVSGIMVNQSHESDSIYDEVVYRMRMTTSTLFQLAGQLTTRILILQVD
jgi:hypothetical protein